MKKVSRKESLTALAVEMMQTRGFSALGLRGLAEAAQMQAASLYSHFASKDELARQSMALYTERQLAEMVSLGARARGGERLAAYVAMVERNLVSQQRLCLGMMLTVEYNALSADVVGEIGQFIGHNTGWLAESWELGRADGSVVSPLAGADVAPVIFNGIEGMLAFCLLQPDPQAVFRQQAMTLLTALGLRA